MISIMSSLFVFVFFFHFFLVTKEYFYYSCCELFVDKYRRMKLSIVLLAILLLCATFTSVQAFDDEEFDFDEIEIQETEETEPVMTKAPTSGSLGGNIFILEGVGVACIILYVVIYLVGSRKNRNLAQNFIHKFEDLFMNQFAEIGMTAGPGKLLIEESGESYRFLASGRRFCEGLMVHIDLKKRQDLISTVMEIFMKSEDIVRVEIPMKEEAMKLMTLAIAQKRDIKKLHKDTPDLADLAAAIQTKKFENTKLAALCENKEMLETVLTNKIVAALVANQKLVRKIHISDAIVSDYMKRFTTTTKMLVFEFALPEDIEQLAPLMEMALFFIDHIAAIRFSPAVITKSKQKRRLIQERKFKEQHAERTEAAKKRKEEREEKKLESLKGADKAEYREKLKQRQMKKRMNNMKVRVG
eukprot:TRINITY_DN773071_c0_g1_i1.p1 TRINITY_DN773071_c0_g1~~TRINITY_DN773071_c0_g1_i1.p1  ORF type:complete len:414 (+),score=129.68 TRINITY_DN773071_c0_g1_i1:137-1378(+)